MIKIIKNATIITVNNKNEILYNTDIVLKDNLIFKITKNYNGKYDEIIDASGKIVMPGLINTHCHLGMSIFRGTNDGYDLMRWLNDLIWPAEEKLSEEDIYWANMLSVVEMIKTGTTTSADMYFGVNKGIQSIKDSKIRQIYTRTLIEENLDENVKEFINLIEENKNNDLITFSVAPHSLYTAQEKTLLKTKELSDKYNLPIHIHFCENKDELKQIKKYWKMSPASVLKKYNLLDKKIVLAHGVYINQQDLKLLKRENVTISHNIVSNLNLGCGCAPINKYLKNKINVSLGTDGQGSGINMNMFNAMNFTSLIAKALEEDPKVLNSEETLRLATINGAKAFGLENDIGSIEENKKADLIILDINNIEIYPTNNILNQIVFNMNSTNVITTIINGEILMQDRKLKLQISENKIKEEIDKIIDKLKLKEKNNE